MKTTKQTPMRHVLAAIVVVLLAMGLAPMAAWATSGDLTAGSGLQAQDEAPAITVHMTISDKGTLALAHQEITVPDINKDGKITVDEALQVTHEQYCPTGKEGYAAPGGWVTKIWGIDTSAVMCYGNDVAYNDSLDKDVISAGDELVAMIFKDDTGWSDHYSYFDKKHVATDPGKEITLKLSAVAWGAPMIAPNVQIGTWKDGKFTAIKGKVTGEDGTVSLAFDEPGSYVVSASGTVNDGGDCPLSAPCTVVTVAADPIKVYMTVSNKGTLALAEKIVTVKDLNKDGIISVDEALQATHAKYCKGGYATTQSSYGLQVIKLWGVESTNVTFFKNDKLFMNNVGQEPVANGDLISANIQKDDKNYSDHYAYFNKKIVNAKVGNKFSLKLSAVAWGEPMVAPNVQVGIWKDGKFKAIKGAVTDKNGKVTLSFDKTGTYVVSAKGSITDQTENACPLSAPACIVKVKAKATNTMNVTVTNKVVKATKVNKKAVTVAPIKVTKAQGAVAFKVTKVTTKNAKKYLKFSKKTGKVKVKKGTPAGTYKFNVKVTAKGNANYKAKSVTKAVTIKVA